MEKKTEDVGTWVISICNSDCDGIDTTLVKGTYENVKKHLFCTAYRFQHEIDTEWECESLTSIDDATENKDRTYIAYFPFAEDFHVDFCATRIDGMKATVLTEDSDEIKSIILSEQLRKYIENYGLDLTEEEEAELFVANNFFDDIEAIFTEGCLKDCPLDELSLEIYEDLEDLGRNADDGCRDDDDTDESFGEFIVQAHTDGNEVGKSALLELSTGRYLMAV